MYDNSYYTMLQNWIHHYFKELFNNCIFLNTQTFLETTVDSGNEISVTDSVSWEVGDEIMLTTTDYNAWHNEVFTIAAISGTTITLDSDIQYKHIGELYFLYLYILHPPWTT